MLDFLSSVPVKVNANVYVKDPESSTLGRKIVNGSIELIDEHGFEGLTFRKLAQQIGSTEASVYRYFESKHKLLLYLTGWYWRWMEYRLVFKTANIESGWERLERAISLLTESIEQDTAHTHVDEVKLRRIVISESSKAYLTKEVDGENKDGVFSGYKALVSRVSDIIVELNPGYKYSHMLVSTVIEGAHHQYFFADHLPRLTNVIEGENSVSDFYKDIVFRAIKD